jgi:hypothetical protein
LQYIIDNCWGQVNFQVICFAKGTQTFQEQICWYFFGPSDQWRDSFEWCPGDEAHASSSVVAGVGSVHLPEVKSTGVVLILWFFASILWLWAKKVGCELWNE